MLQFHDAGCYLYKNIHSISWMNILANMTGDVPRYLEES